MHSKKNIILIIASMAIFVESLDIAIINLTIPSIQQQFGISSAEVQWLQTLYVLLYGGFLIIGGKLSDSIGRKSIFIAGALLFLVTSLGAGLSNSFAILAFFRALQGLGAALIMPSALSIVTHTFTEKQERAKAIGIFSSFAAIGSGSGLSLGGIISTYWGWHWVFLMNVPILIVVIIAAIYFLSKDPDSVRQKSPDILSGLLLLTALLLISYSVHQIGSIRESYGLLSALCIATVVCFSLLYSRLTTHTNPLIDIAIFRSQAVVAANGALFLLGALFTGYLFLISLLFQKDLNFSAATSGLLLVPFSLLSAFVAKFILPSIMRSLSPYSVGILGMTLMVTGTAMLFLALLTGYPIWLLLVSAALITGLGMTICFTSLSVLSIQDIPAAHYGLASSLGSTSYFLGAGIGLSLLALCIQSTSATVVVSYGSVALLGGYAITGLLWLLRYQNKKATTPVQYST